MDGQTAQSLSDGRDIGRRLVFCASRSASIPPEAPAIALIHQALLKRVPVFKKVIYDPTVDGPDDSPPVCPFDKILANALQLHDRWFTKRTKFQAQGEVRVGWLADPIVCFNPIPPLAVAGLGDFARVLG